MPRLGQLSIALVALSCIACGQTLEMDLKSPLRLWDHERGNCGRQRAMDGDGDYWIEDGCQKGESRFEKVRRLTDAEQKRIVAADKALPPPGPDPMGKDCKGNAHYFVERWGDDRRFWRFCAGEGELGDTRIPEPPFQEEV